MTLLGLTLQQLALLFAVSGGAVTLLYILKLRRRRLEVPFAQLWERVLRERESTSLFKRLKRLLSLLLSLLLLFLLVAALGDPRLSDRVLSGRHIVLLIDASASMQAKDGAGGRSRMAEALERARELLRGKSAADRLMLVRMDAQVTPLGPFEGDEKRLLELLEGFTAADTGADLPRALRFCAGALRGRKRPLLLLISDGAFDEQALAAASWGGAAKGTEEPAKAAQTPKKGAKTAATSTRGATAGGGYTLDRVDLSGIDVRHVPVGSRPDNIGIVAFNARRYPRNKLSFEVFLEVVSHRKEQAAVDLQIRSDGQLIEVQRLSLAPGQRTRFVCDPDAPASERAAWCRLASAGKLLEARLVPPDDGAGSAAQALDPFPLDDRAWALIPERRKQQVLLVTRGNLYLEGAMLLDESLAVTRVPPAAYTPKLAEKAEAVVFDRWLPETLPPRPVLALAPPPERSPLPVRGTVQAPLITEQSRSHPVMRWVTLKDVNISSALRFRRGPGVTVLAEAFGEPLAVAARRGGRPLVLLGFDVTASDLPLRVAFPLLVINSLDWFRGADGPGLQGLKTGESWAVPLPAEGGMAAPGQVRVIDPAGRRYFAPVSGGQALLAGSEAGVYTLERDGRRLKLAANLAEPKESAIAPRTELTLSGKTLSRPEGFGLSVRREIWIYLVLLAFLLLGLEWWTYNRRITV